jgi:hypothetical protein
VSDEDLCQALRDRQQFLCRNGQRVKEGLHRHHQLSLPSRLLGWFPIQKLAFWRGLRRTRR